MADILIRGLNSKTLKRLKARAKQHGRSLQGEAKLLLEQASGAGAEDIAAIFDHWKQRFSDRQFTDSSDLIREDRQR